MTNTPPPTEGPAMPTPATRADLAALLAGEQGPYPAEQFEIPEGARLSGRHVRIQYRDTTITRIDQPIDAYNEGKPDWYPQSLRIAVPWGDDQIDFLGDDALPITDGYSIVDVIRAIDTWIDWSLVGGWDGGAR